MAREIEIQRWNYRQDNLNNPAIIVIHPSFYHDIISEIMYAGKSTLMGMEINLSASIEPNEFIIGEKFKVEVSE